jgi:hypothetical protein
MQHLLVHGSSWVDYLDLAPGRGPGVILHTGFGFFVPVLFPNGLVVALYNVGEVG